MKTKRWLLAWIAAFTALPASFTSAATDESVRALLGVRACGVHFAKSDDGAHYVATFAKYVDGKFVGFGPALSGKLLGQSGAVEISWRNDGEGWGFAFVSPSQSVTFTRDEFFSHLEGGSHAQVSCFPSGNPMFEHFRDFGILAVTSSGPEIASAPDLGFLGKSWVRRKYMLICLYRETSGFEESANLSEEVEKAQPNLQ